MPSLLGASRHDITQHVRDVTHHRDYRQAIAAVEASRVAKVKGDMLTERRLLRSALKLTDRIIADVARERLP